MQMHLPYIRKVFQGSVTPLSRLLFDARLKLSMGSCDIKIVPVLVGAINTTKEKAYGKLLAPYLADPKTLFVVSTDFCHWSAMLPGNAAWVFC